MVEFVDLRGGNRKTTDLYKKVNESKPKRLKMEIKVNNDAITRKLQEKDVNPINLISPNKKDVEKRRSK